MTENVIPLKPLTVCVGIPSLDSWAAEFGVSLALLTSTLRSQARLVLVNNRTSWTAHARNMIVETALENDAHFVLMLDSDMAFPPDTFERLLAQGKDIVGADYVRRRPPFGLLGDPKDKSVKFVKGGGLLQMDKMAFGCTLFRTAIFRQMKQPYFTYETHGPVIMGEDYLFCREAQKLGLELWCDLDLTQEVRHIGTRAFGPSDYEGEIPVGAVAHG